MWRTRGGDGEKAVAGYDEDTVTMAVAAALDCIGRSENGVGALYLATTTSPYLEKQSAATIARAVDLDRHCHTADFTNSLRAGMSAMKSAMDAVSAGSVGQVAVVASDCRIGAPRGILEQNLGDGAAALTIGSSGVIAAIEGSYSISHDFTDLWRTDHDAFPRSGEARFIEEVGYTPSMQEAMSGLMEKYSMNPKDFSKVVFYGPHNRAHADLAKKLGFDKSQVQDTLFSRIGNTGTAAAFIMLVAALEEAKKGEAILFAAYGDGADAFVLRATEQAKNIRREPTMEQRTAGKVNIDYGTYLYWRELVPVEASGLPERAEPSLATRWRERKNISALYGFKCNKCGTPQLHPIGQNMRICVACQAKDDFEPYKFSDKTGKLFTYAIDQLQPTRNPPGLNGVIDFDGGGRLICELTDYDIEKAHVGMPVKMTFRKLAQGNGIVNYYWKAKPFAKGV
jgi:3-hydroxy-3-methylglutaryl CoA synthase